MGLATLLGHFYAHLAFEIFTREGFGISQNIGGLAFRNNLAAMNTRTRADIDHPIGLEDRVLIMLDHDNGIAEIAQPLQRAEQPLIIPLMQAYRGLV